MIGAAYAGGMAPAQARASGAREAEGGAPTTISLRKTEGVPSPIT